MMACPGIPNADGRGKSIKVILSSLTSSRQPGLYESKWRRFQALSCVGPCSPKSATHPGPRASSFLKVTPTEPEASPPLPLLLLDHFEVGRYTPISKWKTGFGDRVTTPGVRVGIRVLILPSATLRMRRAEPGRRPASAQLPNCRGALGRSPSVNMETSWPDSWRISSPGQGGVEQPNERQVPDENSPALSPVWGGVSALQELRGCRGAGKLPQAEAGGERRGEAGRQRG